MLGGLESTTNSPDPFLSVNSAMDVSILGRTHGGKGCMRKDTGSMRYAWFGRSETVMFRGCFLAWRVVL